MWVVPAEVGAGGVSGTHRDNLPLTRVKLHSPESDADSPVQTWSKRGKSTFDSSDPTLLQGPYSTDRDFKRISSKIDSMEKQLMQDPSQGQQRVRMMNLNDIKVVGPIGIPIGITPNS